MVVEDDPNVIEVTSLLLEDAGYEVLKANGVGEALDLAASHPGLDVLLADVNLHDECNGIDLARRIRTGGCNAAVVIVSGDLRWSGTEPDDHMCFLAKPFGRATLLEAMRSVCAVQSSDKP